MHFNSVEQVLKQLETQPGWEKFRQHRQLLKCWDHTVNRQIAQHTRPLHIYRQILYVATDSAARAQELSFQRYTLLKRLNKQLTFKIKDIRFSSSQWHQKTYQQTEREILFTISDRSQSKITTKATANSTAISKSLQKSREEQQDNNNEDNYTSPQDRAKNAVLDWLKSKEQRDTAPFCPKCQAATSKEELARWNLCHHCIARQWSEKYRPPTFPDPK